MSAVIPAEPGHAHAHAHAYTLARTQTRGAATLSRGQKLGEAGVCVYHNVLFIGVAVIRRRDLG